MSRVTELKKVKLFTFDMNSDVHECYSYANSLPALNSLLDRNEVLCEYGQPVKVDNEINLLRICGKLSNFVIEEIVDHEDEVRQCLFADFIALGPLEFHCFNPDTQAFKYRLFAKGDSVFKFITWDIVAK